MTNEQTRQSSLTRGQLAREAGVNFSSVRYYERRGLMQPRNRSAGGYHQYGSDDVHRLRFIRRAQELGFTLKEVEELLELRVDAGSHCDEVRQQAEAKITDMQQKIRDLSRMKKALSQLVEACRREERSGHCPVIESLEANR
jgi:Hg(II)-responsive transcriptional regulator